MLVIHHNDLDGRCAAVVVGLKYPQTDYYETDYKIPPPLDLIKKDDIVVIVDFSYKPDDMKKILAKTKNIIWCDHHETAKDYDYGVELDGIRNFEDKGKSGCEVTWDFFFEEECPTFIKLIGDYDAYRLEMTPASLEFYEGMKMEDTNPNSKIWKKLFDNEDTIDNIISQGKIAIRYRDNYCAEMMKSFGYETKIDGIQAYACNMSKVGSLGFGKNFNKYPICIAYTHDGEKYRVTLYSKSIDISKIASNHGGGGHRGAAGFTCEKLPWTKNLKFKEDDVV